MNGVERGEGGEGGDRGEGVEGGERAGANSLGNVRCKKTELSVTMGVVGINVESGLWIVSFIYFGFLSDLYLSS